MSRVCAVVLAAGEATRFGAPKQAVLLPEVLGRVAQSTALDEVVVVGGAHPLPGDIAARLVQCPEWERGPGASLRCGLASLGDDVAAAVVVLADGPDLSPEAIDRVVAAGRAGGGGGGGAAGAARAPEALDRVVAAWRAGAGDVVAASYGRVRGHPLLVSRARWREVPDDGLRVVEPVLVPCDDLGAPGDVDEPGDLPERLRRP